MISQKGGAALKKSSGNGMKILVTTVCILLIVALVTAGNSTVNGFFTGLIFSPLQRAAASLTGGASDAVRPVQDIEKLEEENSKLKEENRRLNDILVEYYDLKEENEKLNKFYDIKESNEDFSMVPSTVIARDPNENFYGFVLDKGTNDGISKDDPVVTENGLVGFVSEVNVRSCKVSAIISPDAKVGAIDKKTENQGILTGTPEYSEQNVAVMKNISAQHKMEKGDIVVTSGYGGKYPKNIRIGTVRSIEHDYNGLPMALIDPFEDVRYIRSAAVITDFSGKGEIETYTSPAAQNSKN